MVPDVRSLLDGLRAKILLSVNAMILGTVVFPSQFQIGVFPK